MKCQKCGTTNPKEAVFCMKCGTKLEPPRCEKCGTINPEEAVFCMKCGNKLTTEPITIEQPIKRPDLNILKSSIPEKLADKILSQKDRIEGERKLVTVMFADVSGFTSLSERLDPEDVNSLMNDCFKIMVDIIYSYEGVIDKFIGDCVMVLFGAPVTHEDDPERAIRCAIDMISAINRFANQEKASAITLHIGINTGTVIAGHVGADLRFEYSVIGDTVNLASRLTDKASSGKILIGENTYQLTKHTFYFKKLEPLQLKGKEKKVNAYEVIRVRTKILPKRGIPGLKSELVGRKEEIKKLKECVDKLFEGQGHFVAITGRAGVGKTRLVEEIKNYIKNKEIYWFEGCGISYNQSTPYLPWLEIVKSWLKVTKDEDEQQIKERIMKQLIPLFNEQVDEVLPYFLNFLSVKLAPQHTDKVKYLDPKTLQLQIFISLRDLLSRISKTKPLILILDDLQWVDTVSIEFLKFLLPRVIKNPILIISLFRLPKRKECEDLLKEAEIKIPTNYTELKLSSLSKKESESLITNLSEVPGIPERLRLKILAKSEGNPFYIEELIRSFIDYETVGDELVTEFNVPDTLHGVIASRIDSLDISTKNILQIASVIGRSFPYQILEHIYQIDTEPTTELPLQSLLKLLEDKQFIIKQDAEKSEYLFEHILTQEVAYNGLLKKRRRKLHRNIGEYIESVFKDEVEHYYRILSWHYFKAEEWQKALVYTQKAASQAKASYANHEAIEYYRRVLSIIDKTEKNIPSISDELQITTLKELAEIQRLIGENQSAVKDIDKALEIATKIDNKKLKADCLIEKGRVFRVLSQYKEAKEVTQEALNLYKELGDEQGRRTAITLIGDIYYYLSKYKEALEYHKLSLKISQDINDRKGECASLITIGNVNAILSNYNEALKYYKQSLAISQERSDKKGESASLNNMGNVYLHIGNFKKALECHQLSLKINQNIGDREGIARSLSNIGNIEKYIDEYNRALEYYQQSLKIKQEIGTPYGETLTLNSIGDIFFNLGEYEKALNYYQQALKISQKTRMRWNEIRSLAGIAGVEAFLGDYKKALLRCEYSLKMCHEIGDTEGEVLSLCIMAGIYRSIGFFKTANEIANKALKLSKRIDARDKTLDAIITMIWSHIEDKKFKKAQSLFEEAKEIGKEIKSKSSLFLLQLLESKLCEVNKDIERAIKLIKKVLKEATNMNRTISEVEALLQLCEILVRSPDTKNEVKKHTKRLLEIGNNTGALPILWKSYWFMYKCTEDKKWFEKFRTSLNKQFTQIPVEHIDDFKNYIGSKYK
jgi:class 3 adenylate cyclase/tetratricopeptide (TPR) repeat protein/ribosomal protein L40E